MTSDEAILRPSRQKLLLPVVFFGFAAAVGWWMDSTGEVGGSFVLVASLAFVAAGLVQLLPGAAWLKLTPEGFQIRAMFKTRELVRWRDVALFEAQRAYRNPVVSYRFARSGLSGTLTETYGMTAQELAALLEEWRARFTKPASPTPR